MLVQHGEDLRRFNVPVDANNRLELDIVGFKTKIRSIFNFTDGINFVLKYIDEDGDLVTLTRDEDLHDIMRQQLKFLRINAYIDIVSSVSDNGVSDNGASASMMRISPQ
ncbi:hypothetical protein RJT34_32430 [Clitoria ternatea]|uniref:PB1 domain-containing protein n=1 Tax=Clitoria ternatea TaxID=43366 RepID=A0AAN9I4J8_CLITE